MYFYQKNFIYDISSYPKTKNTTNNTLTISNLDISDLDYYYNTNTRPKILLSTGNFSPWGANDVLLADNWNITQDTITETYTLTLYISNLDITTYDITQIRYLIFLDDINTLQISSDDTNFNKLILKTNTILRIKFNNNTTKDFYLPANTSLTKTSTTLTIQSNHIYNSAVVNFSTIALKQINLGNNIPHFINFKIQRPSNTSSKILRVQFWLSDNSSGPLFLIQTYYFSSFSGETYNTFTLTPLYYSGSNNFYSNFLFQMFLAWTSDGSTLTLENTNITIEWSWFLPINNLTIYF
jgi:hypothetical protein